MKLLVKAINNYLKLTKQAQVAVLIDKLKSKNVDESITSLACYYSNHNEDCHKRYKEFVAKQAGLNVKLNEDQKKIIRLID